MALRVGEVDEPLRFALVGDVLGRFGRLVAKEPDHAGRIGLVVELLGLRWADVNLEAGTLAVRHTRNSRTGALAEPKTERSRRTLRLGIELAGALQEHRRRQLEERLAAGPHWHDEDYVFAAPNGRSLDAANVSHRFHATLEAAGLPRQRFHDLRHACATLRLEQGEELAVVSRILGHASITTTANVYGHLTDAMLGRAGSDRRHPRPRGRYGRLKWYSRVVQTQ